MQGQKREMGDYVTVAGVCFWPCNILLYTFFLSCSRATAVRERPGDPHMDFHWMLNLFTCVVSFHFACMTNLGLKPSRSSSLGEIINHI